LGWFLAYLVLGFLLGNEGSGSFLLPTTDIFGRGRGTFCSGLTTPPAKKWEFFSLPWRKNRKKESILGRGRAKFCSGQTTPPAKKWTFLRSLPCPFACGVKKVNKDLEIDLLKGKREVDQRG
jgi:hypothetical protein